jgi:hypothetical protein
MSNLATITTNILADSGIDDINVIVSTGSYTNPSWIVSLPWTKITGAPANIVTGTGTVGQVAYWSSGSAITGEANLFWDATNDRLGIGTNTPGVRLDVVGGYISSGTAASTSGSKILWGNYSNGALTTFGSSFSSGGPVIGYGVSPSTSAEFAFVSSTGITLSRGAYYIAGGVHYWYAGASQTAAVDSAVTMVNTMSLSASGNLSTIGGFEIPNGQFYKARRSSGSLLTDMIGIPSGTDDVRLLTTGDFNILNGSLTNLMTVKNGGNVGIGTTSINHILEIAPLATYGNAEDGNICIVANTSGGTVTSPTTVGGIIFGDNTVTNSYVGRIAVIQDNPSASTASHMRFYTNSGGGNGATTEKLRITASGNVGIGTASPLLTATDRGNLTINGSVSSILTFGIANAYSGYIFSGGTNLEIDAQGSRFIQFNTNGQERMRITSGGNVGIGTTTVSELLDIRGANRDETSGQFNQVIYSTSSQNIGIGGSIGLGGFYTGTSLSTTFGAIKGLKENGFGDNTAGVLGFYTRPNAGAMTERMRITSGGNVLIGTTTNGVRLVNSGGLNSTSPTLGSGTIGSDAILSANGLYGLYTGVSDAGHVWMQVQRNDATTPVYPLSLQPVGGGVLIGTTTAPTPVSGVAFPLTVTSSAATRIRIDSTNASPNSGVGLYANGVQKFSFAMYGATSDFTIYNDALLAPSLTVKGTNSNVLIGTTDDNGSKLRVAGGIGFFDSGIKTGTLDTGYVAGTWKLGRAVMGTQPSETHQIIVEINGALFVIGAASL